MMTVPAKATAGEAMADNELGIESVLTRFNGDARSALEAALSDIAHLQRELLFASLAMSYGFARGWSPSTTSDPVALDCTPARRF